MRFITFVKKVIHLIPPLEAKVWSIIDPTAIDTTKEELILTEEGQKIYDELIRRMEKK